MIGLDSNILIRYLVQDNPVQSRKASQVFERVLSDKNCGFVGGRVADPSPRRVGVCCSSIPKRQSGPSLRIRTLPRVRILDLLAVIRIAGAFEYLTFTLLNR